MKNILFIFVLFICGCSTTNQSSEPTRHYLLVTLVDGINGKHLQKTYNADGVESIRPNNRTKNIYACQFVKDQKALKELMDRMNRDVNIADVEVAEVNTSVPTNSTNSNKTKAKPGKN